MVPRKARRKRLLTGLREELGALQARMAVLHWNLVDRDADQSRDEITWVLSRMSRGADDTGFREKMAEALDFSDEAIAQLRQVSKARRKDAAISFRTGGMPFLDAHLPEIMSIGNAKTITSVLNVRNQVRFFNEQVLEGKDFLRMTFDSSLTPDNHQRAILVVEGVYVALRRRSMWIADQIETLLTTSRTFR